jgi:hypothetical protein
MRTRLPLVRVIALFSAIFVCAGLANPGAVLRNVQLSTQLAAASDAVKPTICAVGAGAVLTVPPPPQEIGTPSIAASPFFTQSYHSYEDETSPSAGDANTAAAATAPVAFAPLNMRHSKALTSRWVSDISSAGRGAARLIRGLERSPVLSTRAADPDAPPRENSKYHITRPLSEIEWSFDGVMRDPYFGSLGTMWLVNFVFAGFIAVCWLVFCVCRACGKGGRNWATQYYTTCAVNAHLILLLLFAAGTVVICAFAWTANVDFSRAMDEAFNSADTGMDYFQGFSPLLTSLAATGDRALVVSTALAAAITTNTPAAADVEQKVTDWGDCLATVTPILQQQEAVAKPLSQCATVSPDGVSAATALGDLSTSDVAVARNFGQPARSAEATSLGALLSSPLIPALADAAAINPDGLGAEAAVYLTNAAAVSAVVTAGPGGDAAQTPATQAALVSPLVAPLQAALLTTNVVTTLFVGAGSLSGVSLDAYRAEISKAAAAQDLTYLRAATMAMRSQLAAVPPAHTAAATGYLDVLTVAVVPSPQDVGASTVQTTVLGAQLLRTRTSLTAFTDAVAAVRAAAVSQTPNLDDVYATALAARAAAAALEAAFAAVESTVTATGARLATARNAMAKIKAAFSFLQAPFDPAATQQQLDDVLAVLPGAACAETAIPGIAGFNTQVAALPAVAAAAASGGAYAARQAGDLAGFTPNSNAAVQDLSDLAAALAALTPGTDYDSTLSAADTAAAELASLSTAGFATARAAQMYLTDAEASVSAAFSAATGLTVTSSSSAKSSVFGFAERVAADAAAAQTAITAALAALNSVASGMSSLTTQFTNPYGSIITLSPPLVTALGDATTALAANDADYVAAGGFSGPVRNALLNAIDAFRPPVATITTPESGKPASPLSVVATALTTAIAQTNSAGMSMQLPAERVAASFGASAGAALSADATLDLHLAVEAALTRYVNQAAAVHGACSGVAGTSILSNGFPDGQALASLAALPNAQSQLAAIDAAALTALQPASEPGLKGYAAYADSNGYILAASDRDVNSVASSPEANPAPGESVGDRTTRLVALAAAATTAGLAGGPAATVAKAQLPAIALFAAVVPTSVFDNLQSYASGLASSVVPRRDSVDSTLRSYTTTRQDTLDIVDRWDGVRLLIVNIIILAPFIFFFLAILAYGIGWNLPSMFTGHVVTGAVVLLFVAAGVFLPFAAVAADHCDDPPAHITTLLANIQFKATDLSFLGVTQDVDIPAMVRYLLQCEGPVPEVIALLADPEPIFAAQGLDITAITASLTSVPTLTPTVAMSASLNELTSLLTLGEGAFRDFAAKLNCAATQPIYNDLDDNVCKDLAPAASLAAVMIILLCMVSVLGLIIACRAYKRFDPKWQKDTNTVNPDDRPINGHGRSTYSTPQGGW